MSLNSTSIESQFNLSKDNSNSGRIYEFEGFRLDVAKLMLYRHDEAVQLAPKVVETLLVLVEQPGKIVGKEEMMRRLWADSFVEEANLTQNIYLLRKTLGNGADGKPLIETFRRRGYRFKGATKTFLPKEKLEILPTAIVNTQIVAKDVPENDSPPSVKNSVLATRLSGQTKFYWAAGFFLLILLIFGFGWFRFNLQRNALPLSTATAQTPQNISLKRLLPNGFTLNPAMSPNGEFVAYVKLESKEGNTLWLKNLIDNTTVRLLPPVVKGYQGLQFSPDNQQIYFLNVQKHTAQNVIARVSIFGGEPETIVENVSSWFALAPDGKRVASVRGDSLMIAKTDEIAERVLAKREGKAKWFAVRNSQPAWSPDNKRLMICGGYSEQGKKYPELIEFTVESGAEKRFPTPNWSQLGTLAWLSSGNGLLVTAREDADKPLQIWHLSYPDGRANRVTIDLHNYSWLSLSADSRKLVAEQMIGQSDIWIASMKEPSRAAQLSVSTVENTGFAGLAFMPNGKIVYSSRQNGNLDLWTMNSDGSDQKQLTVNAGEWNGRPRATPDGRYIVWQSFSSDKNHIWRINADGSNPLLLTNSGGESSPNVSPDGQWVYYTVSVGDSISIWKVSINGGEPERISKDGSFSSPAISPDGKLIACERLEPDSKTWKIAVISAKSGELLKTFQEKAFRRTIFWTEDGNSLIYIQYLSANLWRLPLDGSPPVQFTQFGPEQAWDFAVSSDYQQIAVARGNVSSESVLISNFLPN